MPEPAECSARRIFSASTTTLTRSTRHISTRTSAPSSYAAALTLTLLLGLICARAVWRSYDLNTPRGQRTTAKGGQRLITVLIYLSDVEEVSEPTSQSCSQPAPHAVVILDDTPLSICPSVRLPPSVSAWGNANGAAGVG